MAEDTTGLELVVVDKNNSVYRTTFDANSSLKTIKGDKKEWKAF